MDLKVVTLLPTSNTIRSDYGDHRHLPVDVLEDIILKLPVKHVLRCKSLSKTCYYLIRNPRFIKRHLVHHKSTSTNNNIISLVDGYVFDGDDRKHKIVCLLPYPHSGVYFTPHLGPKLSTDSGYSYEIVGSCNGLLCAQVRYPYYVYKRRTVLVWNPATGEQLTLHPPPPDENNSSHRRDVRFGFGYDATSDDYKLVIIYSSGSDRGTMKIWSLKTNTWGENNINSSEIVIYRHGVFVQGNLYWLSVKQGRTTLASFGTVDDTFRTDIELPSDANAVRGQMSITDHMGSLALSIRFYHYSNRAEIVSFEVWVMDDHKTNSSWTKKYSIGPFGRLVGLMGINNRGKFVMREFESGKYFLYDPDSKEENYLSQDNKLLHQHVCGKQGWTFSESLVSLKSADNDGMVG